MITFKNSHTLANITPKKVLEAIANGSDVKVEEHVVNTACRMTRTHYAEIDGNVYKMSARGYNQVAKCNGSKWYTACTRFGGYEGYKFN